MLTPKILKSSSPINQGIRPFNTIHMNGEIRAVACGSQKRESAQLVYTNVRQQQTQNTNTNNN